MTVRFNPLEEAALRIAGVPHTVEDYLKLKRGKRDAVRETIKRELLGPGLDDNMDLNEYGDALRNALDTITKAEWEEEHMAVSA